MRLDVRRAQPSEVDVVLDLLAEASTWLRGKGIIQWPVRFRRSLIEEGVRQGEVYVAVSEGEIVATITVVSSDPPFWGDRDDALFVHRLAVRRSHAGVGRELIEWIVGQTLQGGRSFVCLDCFSANERLRRYYEELGFRRVKEISGPMEHPHEAADDHWTATLYEKDVRPAQLVLRTERESEFDEIDQLVHQAFGGRWSEPALVSSLRSASSYRPEFAVVAERGGVLVGHCMLSTVELLGSEASAWQILALAPLSVMPDAQRMGVGSALVKFELDLAENARESLIVVLGDPDYYGRFGFEEASGLDIFPPEGVPPNVFSVKRLSSYRRELRGTVHYPSAFAETGTL